MFSVLCPLVLKDHKADFKDVVHGSLKVQLKLTFFCKKKSIVLYYSWFDLNEGTCVCNTTTVKHYYYIFGSTVKRAFLFAKKSNAFFLQSSTCLFSFLKEAIASNIKERKEA